MSVNCNIEEVLKHIKKDNLVVERMNEMNQSSIYYHITSQMNESSNESESMNESINHKMNRINQSICDCSIKILEDFNYYCWLESASFGILFLVEIYRMKQFLRYQIILGE